jgi:hypothetical protein
MILVIIFKNDSIVSHNIDTDNDTSHNTKLIEGMINVESTESVGKPIWHITDCPHSQLQVQKSVIDESKNDKLYDSSEIQPEFYLPCGYNLINNEINKLPKTENGRYFIIDGADQISAKNLLWANIVAHHGLKKAKMLSPESFIFSRSEDIDRLKNKHKKGKLYIMKKNIQRQQGLSITDDLNTILHKHSGYVLAQELLQDPYMIKGRKINLRVYVLVICEKSNMDVYVYDDGFMYYTPEKFKKGSTEAKYNITTGYVDRWIYEVHPLTHTDFKKYLDMERKEMSAIEKNIKDQGLLISDIIFNRINKLMADVFVCFKGQICRSGTKFHDNITYQLFGADVSISDQLNAQIIEINKGPDLGAKDEKDGKIKQDLMRDVYKILGGLKNDGNKFTQVLEIKNNIVAFS